MGAPLVLRDLVVYHELMVVSADSAARALVARTERERALLASRVASARACLAAAARCLRQRFGAERVWLFGSFAWDTPHAGSDIDLAVRGVATERLGLAEAEVSRIVGWPVELFDLDALEPAFRRRIEAEGTELTP